MGTNETFKETITVKDAWESGGQRYRLVNMGAGPDRLQTINPLTDDTDWRPEPDRYLLGVLCSRIYALTADKRGCRDERAAARVRGENEIQRLTAILRRNSMCAECGETTFDGDCQCPNNENNDTTAKKGGRDE